MFSKSFDPSDLKWKVPVSGSMPHQPWQWFLNLMFTNNNCYPNDLGKSHIWTLKICPTCSGSSCFTIYLYIYGVRWMYR